MDFKSKRLLLLAVSTIMMALPGSGQIVEQLLRQGWRTDFERSIIDMGDLSVNVPRDAIPPIDEPEFISIADASNWLKDREPVIVVAMNGHARAYPLQVLTWHEIVNDDFRGHPIVVTFCPLCYSALAFDRHLDGELYDFGVSGMLRHSDLVMYDRQTHTLFQQLNGEGLVGTLAGKRLTPVPAQIISFAQFKSAWPDADVLSRNTGHSRDYGRNPYPGYDDIDDKPWLFKGEEDSRLRPMEKVVGVTVGDEAKAWPHSVTKKLRVINDELGGVELVVFHTKKGATSALDKANIARSKNLGSTGVFRRLHEGKILTFEADGDVFTDLQTGSTWDITGLAVAGPLSGSRLVSIAHGDIFSFAWFVTYPETQLYSVK